MKKEEIAQRLIIGSRNIDQMRIEIKQLISMIVGYITINEKKEFRKSFQTEGFNWVISNIVNGTFSSFDGVKVECYYLPSKEGKGCILDSQSKEGFPFQAAEVQNVYNDLSNFISEIVKMFPWIEQAWKPLITASTAEVRYSKEIVLTKRSDDIHACLKNHPEIWGNGNNSYEAIGNLINAHSKLFGISINRLQ